jgi:hypothetical protein
MLTCMLFKLALATHSIKNEFQYNMDKSDSERFMAHCAAKDLGCNWRIHASTFGDNVTIKVMLFFWLCLQLLVLTFVSASTFVSAVYYFSIL